MPYKQMFEIHAAIEKFVNPPNESMHTIITQSQIISDRASCTKNKHCCCLNVFFCGEIKHIAQIYRMNKKCILSESHRIQSVSSMPKVIITRATNYFHCYGAFARITLICIATETLNLLQ